MTTHSSTLAWKISWTEEPGRLQSMGSLKSRTQLSDFTFTFHFHALEKEMATHSSVLAWRIPGTGEPGGLPSMGSHRVQHDWSDLAAAAAAAGNSRIWFRRETKNSGPFGTKSSENRPKKFFAFLLRIRTLGNKAAFATSKSGSSFQVPFSVALKLEYYL